MSGPFASGDNYSIELDGFHGIVRVWRRPDLDSATGARDANEMTELLKRLLLSKRMRSLLFDLRNAPPIAGPRTVETMGELLGACERALARIAVLVSSDPVQVLQFRRLVMTHAPSQGRVASTLADAESWVAPKTPRG